MTNLSMFIANFCLHIFLWSVVTGVGILLLKVMCGLAGIKLDRLERTFEWFFDDDGIYMVLVLAGASLIAAIVIFIIAALTMGG